MKPLIVLAAAAALVGCGTSNKALKTEHYVRPAAEDPADDNVTVARLAGDRSVSTEYNMRYTLTATLPAGDFVLRGTDGGGGRYFMHRFLAPVTLSYSGLALTGQVAPEKMVGGVFIDAGGDHWIYWHWDGEASPAVRIPAPGLVATITKEVDEGRRRARLEREAEERRAAAAREAAEAARLQAQQKKDELRARLAEVRAQDRVQCEGADCERAFAWAQAYLLQQADMRIQVATPTLIETYNATSDGQVQMRLLRVPTTGNRWEIVLSAHCRDDRKSSEDLCTLRLIDAYGGFLPHMRRR